MSGAVILLMFPTALVAAALLVAIKRQDGPSTKLFVFGLIVLIVTMLWIGL